MNERTFQNQDIKNYDQSDICKAVMIKEACFGKGKAFFVFSSVGPLVQSAE
jgi:hypothetical protein